MRQLYTVPIITLGLLVSLTLPGTAPPTDDMNFEFACGEDEPPSGPYLESTTLQIFDYDCVTQTLTLNTLALNRCVLETDSEGNLSATTGICIILTPNDVKKEYATEVLVAIVDSYTTSWYTHPHTTPMDGATEPYGTESECPQAPCGSPSAFCGSNGTVTYCRDADVWNCDIYSLRHESSGHVILESQIGNEIENGHTNVVDVC